MQLYVGGLSDDIKEVDVEKVFSGVCLPQLVTIIRDIESGKSRGFAIVKILSEEKGEEAIRHLSGTMLRGRNIVVRRMPETLLAALNLGEQNRLLKESVSRLSHSVRQFRNLVHLSAEKTKKHTISKATAIGAVSSIFTIANDFLLEYPLLSTYPRFSTIHFTLSPYPPETPVHAS